MMEFFRTDTEAEVTRSDAESLLTEGVVDSVVIESDGKAGRIDRVTEYPATEAEPGFFVVVNGKQWLGMEDTTEDAIGIAEAMFASF